MQQNRRSAGIDGLRGLAALLVVLHHIHLRFRLNRYDVNDLLPDSLERIVFWSGYYAVIVFFVISGFLIARLSMERWGEVHRISIKHFYVLRLARIAPCLLALLLVSSALHLAAISPFVINPDRASLPRALLAALTFHVNWLEGSRGYLPGTWDVLWSLSVEELFYLLFPLVCVCVRSERLLLVVALALIVVGPINRAALGGQSPWGDYAYLSCMDGMAFGCITAWISMRMRVGFTMLRIGLAVGLAAMLLVLVFRKTSVSLGLAQAGLNITLLEAGTALVLLAFANNVGERMLDKLKLLQVVGRCSYEVYLTHMFVVLGLMQWLNVIKPEGVMIPLWYAVMLFLSLTLGYAVSRWFSEPANRLVRLKLGVMKLQTKTHATLRAAVP
jgi:peptidoglycan/LPS O-acetylase OafA/YrhL